MSKDRLAELMEKETLTTEEVFELERLHGREPVELPSLSLQVGEAFIDQAMKNILSLQDRVTIAKNAKCYIEVLVLQFSNLEILLHMYWRDRDQASYSSVAKPTFGVCIKECKRLGLLELVCTGLSEINSKRNDLIHGFSHGRIDYSELEPLCKEAHAMINLLLNTLSDLIGQSGNSKITYEKGAVLFSRSQQ